MKILLTIVLLAVMCSTAHSQNIGEVYDGAGVIGDATEQDNASTEELRGYAHQFWTMGKWNAAEVLYDKYFERDPKAGSKKERAEFELIFSKYWAACLVGDTTRALQTATEFEALAASAKDATVAIEAAYEAGSVYVALRSNGEKALEMFDRVPDFYNGHHRVLYMRAWCHQDIGDVTAAQQAYDTFLDNAEPEESWRGLAWWNKAEMYLKADSEVQAASAYYQADLAGFPKDGTALYMAAYSHKLRALRLGDAIDLEENRNISRDLFEKFIKDYANHPWVPVANNILEAEMIE